MSWFGLLFGALSAGFSIFQGIRKSQAAQEEIWAQKEQERITREARIREQRERTNREIAYATKAFEIERDDAFRKADDIWHQGERIDMRADLDETLTGRAFNAAMQKNNLEDESLLLQQQRGKQNFLNQHGAQQVAFGMSGARNGHNSAQLVLQQNEQNFNQDIDLMNRQREQQKQINLMHAFTNLKSGMFRIDEERDAANIAFRDSKQLRDDYTGEIIDEDIGAQLSTQKDAIHKEYEAKRVALAKEYTSFSPAATIGELANKAERLTEEERQKIEELKKTYAQKQQSKSGGRAVNLFNTKIANTRADLEGSIDLQNLDGGVKQAALNRAHQRAHYTVIDGLTNVFQGFSSGFNMGSKISDFYDKWARTQNTSANDAGMSAGKAGGLGSTHLFSDFGTGSAYYGQRKRYRDPFGFMFG